MTGNTRKNISDFLVSISDPDFCAQALAEYLQSTSSYQEQLISACDEAVSDTSIIDNPDMDPNNIIDDILSHYDKLNGDVSVSFNEGYTSTRDLLSNLLTVGDLVADPAGHAENLTIYDVSDLFSLKLKDIDGYLNGAKLSVDDIRTQLNDNLHHTWVAASALAASTAETAADRITLFTEAVKEKFKDAYTDVSNAFSYYKSQLSSKFSDAKGMVSAFLKDINVDAMLNPSDDYVPANNNISQFTGSSPINGLNLKEGFENVGSTIKNVTIAVGTVIGGIMQGIWKVAQPLFHKVKNAVVSVTSNPFDITVEDASGENYGVDGFCHQVRYTLINQLVPKTGDSTSKWTNLVKQWLGLTGQNYSNPNYVAEWANVQSFLEDLVGVDRKMKTIFGEVLVRIESIVAIYHNSDWTEKGEIPLSLVSSYNDNEVAVLITVVNQYKPFPCDGEDFINAVRIVAPNTPVIHPGGDQNRYSFPSLSSALLPQIFQQISLAGGFRVQNYDAASGSDNEKRVFAAYYNGLNLLRLCTASLNNTMASYMWNETDVSVSLELDVYIMKDGTSVDVPGAVTNLDFLNVAFSNRDRTRDIDGTHDGEHEYNASAWELPSQMAGFAPIMLFQAADKFYHPASYIFVPYSDADAQFSSCKCRLKTDEDNANVLSTAIAGLIVIVVVAALAITLTVKLKKFKRAKLQKKMNYLGKMDNEMWNNPSTAFTDREMRKYIRYKNKVDNSSLFSSGMVTTAAASNPTMTVNNGSDVGVIARLICGSSIE